MEEELLCNVRQLRPLVVWFVITLIEERCWREPCFGQLASEASMRSLFLSNVVIILFFFFYILGMLDVFEMNDQFRLSEITRF